MSTLQLPPSQVIGYSPYLYDVTRGGAIDDVIANSPTMWMFFQQNADEHFRVDMYKQGDWFSALNSLLRWGQSEAMLGMGQAAVANYNVAKKLFSPSEAITFGMNDKVDHLPGYDAELSGSVFSPIAALYHSFTGNGTPMWANLNNLGLHFEIGEFAVVQDAMMSAMEGTTPFSVEKISYNTANDSLVTAAYLGNITLKLE